MQQPTLHICKNAAEYLAATESYLLQRELHNNIMLGVCNNIADKHAVNKKYRFAYVTTHGNVTGAVMNTTAKVILAAYEPNNVAPLVTFYRQSGLALQGVVGEAKAAELFAQTYHGSNVTVRTVIVHGLQHLNTIAMPEGDMIKATVDDANLLADWAFQFQEDVNSFPKKTKVDVYKNTAQLINSGSLFKWLHNGNIVSMAAIIRHTRNIGIVGLVYTPAHLRGSGYASAIVHTLTQHILNSGFASAGLFTEKVNPISNLIYKRIGYVADGEFSDVEFK